FEIPVAVFLLIWTGIVEPESLEGKRPYVIVGCFIVGMLLTPPDPFTQSMLAIPLWMLFELGIFFGKLIRKRQRAAEEKAASESNPQYESHRTIIFQRDPHICPKATGGKADSGL